MREELKRCPFCGGKPVTYHDFFGKDFSSVHIKCDGCSSLSGTYTHEHQVIEAWNKRVLDAPKIGLSEEYFNSYREDLE